MLLHNTYIPPDLQFFNSSEGDVSILIGENGSGKSQMLAFLTRRYLAQGKKVIAISNSIHDKFPDNGRNLHLLRDRAGRQKAKRSIKHALLNISTEEITRFKNASEALRFIGYDPVIGIERIEISESTLNDAISSHPTESALNVRQLEELKSLLFKSSSTISEEIIWLSLSEFSFYEIDRISFIQLLKYETLLKKLSIIKGINLYLRKDGQTIPLYDASSGELSFISSIIYLATTIDDNSAVLIDEPENSLHPSWQKDYIKILIQLFYLYQPKIVAATHSALVVTGAEIANERTNVFECRNFQFIKKAKEPINIEEAFYSYFNVVTPENRYLSDYIVDLLNKLAEKEISYNSLLTELNKWQNKSFDPKQVEVLDGLREIAAKINNSNAQPNE
ncbi:AAA family ATPase [Pararcticibacter amylolyticus]|uniref:ATPase AAA-type core domain-containing protein n=1 Tax=Pararcticibacter amylolyticus TaxID=2173175 RepID=A0A2U2PMG7_9SPHI|nr:AAA family ATPase [Pararcticibacter amylolyticus]PWG82596.1 hypothetical protein DDR33_01670 [Pararcticibacter amylolyticus]